MVVRRRHGLRIEVVRPRAEGADHEAVALKRLVEDGLATADPNRGVRGYAGAPRASNYGRIKDYAHRCEDEICVLVQVETVLGLQNLEAIANVDGIDGVFIGPGDLSAALGHLGNPKHPEVLAAIDDAIARIRACGKAAGILTGDEALAKHYVDQGCLFVAVGADQNVLRDSATALAGRFKA